MSFLDAIERARQKPERERRRMLGAALAFFMIIIVALWLLRVVQRREPDAARAQGPFFVIRKTAAELSTQLRDLLR